LRDNAREMPKVLFVNEHREVEVEAGRLISDVAEELGIAVCRQHFAGIPFGDWSVWVDGPTGCVSPMTALERLWDRCAGWRRSANRTRILGDCKIHTQQGLASRARVPRPIDPVPVPSTDPQAERFDHENNAAGTAWNVYGHPKAVGLGKREAPKYEPPKKGRKAAESEDDEAENAGESE